MSLEAFRWFCRWNRVFWFCRWNPASGSLPLRSSSYNTVVEIQTLDACRWQPVVRIYLCWFCRWNPDSGSLSLEYTVVGSVVEILSLEYCRWDQVFEIMSFSWSLESCRWFCNWNHVYFWLNFLESYRWFCRWKPVVWIFSLILSCEIILSLKFCHWKPVVLIFLFE